ncbi:MAG: ABC transporter ATP-binding protein [Candidatus Thorarchaeota archaeon]|jgi:branched-chain amino acid transport system ATP-binding protein
MLDIQNVTRRFGGVVAVNDVTMQVEHGAIHGLIGPNGSGKTTLLNLISGLYSLNNGSIHVDGKRIDGLSPYQIAMSGVTRTFQITKLFTKMTVIENMLVPGLASGTYHTEEEAIEKADELLGLISLDHLRNEPASNLSGGQGKLLEFGRAFMMSPKLILVDEPFEGVNPVIQEELEKMLNVMNDEGVTIFIVSHDIPCIMGLCGVITVLANGQVISEGSANEVREDPLVIEAYLGG